MSCHTCRIAAGVIYWGNAKLGQQLRATAGTLLTATDGIQSEINNALSMVQVASMFPISQQGSSQQFLQACVNLGNTFNNLQKKVKKNKDRVYRIFDNVYVPYPHALLITYSISGVELPTRRKRPYRSSMKTSHDTLWKRASVYLTSSKRCMFLSYIASNSSCLTSTYSTYGLQEGGFDGRLSRPRRVCSSRTW